MKSLFFVSLVFSLSLLAMDSSEVADALDAIDGTDLITTTR